MKAIPSNESLITGPTLEPIDLDEAKKSIRFTSTTEDTLIDTWISAARMYFETETDRQVMTATWEYWLDCFPSQCEIELPHPPLRSVLSVKYDDTDGVEQTLSSALYRVDATSGPFCKRGRLVLLSGTEWPETIYQPSSVRIRYTAGYGDVPGDVPELIKAAIFFMVNHFFKFRAEVYESRQGHALQSLPIGAKAILSGFKFSSQQTLVPTK